MATPAMEEAVELNEELVPCGICGRTFLPTPLRTHMKVCERNATRKRKVFNSLKQRVEGTDLADFHKKRYLKKTENQSHQPVLNNCADKSKNNKNTSKWKEKHEEFVEAIIAAKGDQDMGARRSISGVGTMGITERCPSCDRQFGPKAFDRHVEWCKERKTRVQQPNPANVLMAKERLEARTKYRVPSLIKTKRSSTRDKYSPISRTESLVSVRSSTSVDRSPSIRKPKQAIMSNQPQDRRVSDTIMKNPSPTVSNKSPCVKPRNSLPIPQVAQKTNTVKKVNSTTKPVYPKPRTNTEKKYANMKSNITLNKLIPGPVGKSISKSVIEPKKCHLSKTTGPTYKNKDEPKLNNLKVNDNILGLTVSEYNVSQGNSKLVTWKDTIQTKGNKKIVNVKKSDKRNSKEMYNKDEDMMSVDSDLLNKAKKYAAFKIKREIEEKTVNAKKLDKRTCKDNSNKHENTTNVDSDLFNESKKYTAFKVKKEIEENYVKDKKFDKRNCKENCNKDEDTISVHSDLLNEARKYAAFKIKKEMEKRAVSVPKNSNNKNLKGNYDKDEDGASVTSDHTINNLTFTRKRAGEQNIASAKKSNNCENKKNCEYVGDIDETVESDGTLNKAMCASYDVSRAEPTDSFDILTIMKPSADSTYEVDSLCSDKDWDTRKTNSNIEFVRQHLSNRSCLENGGSNNDVSREEVWEIAEKQFLQSMKNEVDNSTVFKEELQNKNTSTPVRELCDLDIVVRSEAPQGNKYDFSTSYVDLPIPNVNSAKKSSLKSGKGCNVSAYFGDVSSPESISFGDPEKFEENRKEYPICNQELLSSIEANVFFSDKTDGVACHLLETSLENMISNCTATNNCQLIIDSNPMIKTQYNKKYDIKNLEDYIQNNQGKECELEVEILKTQNFTKDVEFIKDLNAHSIKSGDIVFKGENCLDILNQLLVHNEVKSVNILFGHKGFDKEPYIDEDNKLNNVIIHSRAQKQKFSEDLEKSYSENEFDYFENNLSEDTQKNELRSCDDRYSEISPKENIHMKEETQYDDDHFDEYAEEDVDDNSVFNDARIEISEEDNTYSEQVNIENSDGEIVTEELNEINGNMETGNEEEYLIVHQGRFTDNECDDNVGKFPKIINRKTSSQNSGNISDNGSVQDVLEKCLLPNINETRHADQQSKSKSFYLEQRPQSNTQLPKIDEIKTGPCQIFKRDSTFIKLTLPRLTPEVKVDSTTPRSVSDSELHLPAIFTPRPPDSFDPDYDPFVTAERQLMELLHCDDFKTPTNSSNTLQQSSHITNITKPKSSLKNINKSQGSSKSSSANNSKTNSATKRASVIDPPSDFQDPNFQDNFEAIENYINDNYGKNTQSSHNQNSKITNNKNANKNKVAKDTLSLNSILAKRKYSDDMSCIDPQLINENDNLSIPDNLPLENYSPGELDHYSVQYDRKISSLEPLVLPKTEMFKRSLSTNSKETIDDIDFDEFLSSFDDDECFPTLKSFLHTTKSELSDKKSAHKKSTVSLHSSFGKSSPGDSPENKKFLAPIKRSVSLSNPVVKARSMKNKQDIQDYLHVKDSKPTKKEQDSLYEKTSPNSSELFTTDHEMYEEYKKYEEMYLREKMDQNDGRNESNREAEYDDECSDNDEVQVETKTLMNKVSGDSAYGSLNRNPSKTRSRPARTPKTSQTPKRQTHERSPSSSGSEMPALPPKSRSDSQKMSKFCHECGNKFPVSTAKFCVECGVRRLTL